MSPCLSYFCRNPVFEVFRRWKFAAKDKGVEAGFVDNGHSSWRIKTVVLAVLLICCIYVLFQSPKSIWIPQRSSHIFSYKPWFPWDFNSSQLTKFWMIEHCWDFCWCGRFWEMSRPGDVPSLCAFFQRCLFVTHPHSSRRKNAYSILPPGEMSMFPIHRCWWMRNYQLSHIKKVYKILLTLFEYISQKSISVSRGTLSQPCQKNKSSGCILNQTYYFACNITFI